MKHIFIINPAAGKVDSTELIREKLSEIGDQYDCECYITRSPGDATQYIRTWCTEHPSERVRFYACGGDGTLNEVVNGVVGFDHASVACYPCGSGDDFIKYYGGHDKFTDIRKLLCAPEEKIDLLSVNGRYSVNITNFGFDTTVAKTMIRVKRKKIIGGKNAYTTGVLVGLLRAMKNRCTVTADGEVLNPKGTMLLCTLANGCYVGGSFYCAPLSNNRDGKMEVTLFRPLSRFTFVKLISAYTNGTHLSDARFAKYITYRQAEKVTIDAPEGFSLSLDGEIVDGTHFEVSVLKQALRFAVPEDAAMIAGRSGEAVAAADVFEPIEMVAPENAAEASPAVL